MSEARRGSTGSSGTIEKFSQSRGMGSIRLADGRVATFARSSLVTPGQPRANRHVDVSLRIRAGRLIATEVRFTSSRTANSRGRSKKDRAASQGTQSAITTSSAAPSSRRPSKRKRPIPPKAVATVRAAASVPGGRARRSGASRPQESDQLRALTAELTREIRILLVGRTGTGKSTTVNSLLGYEVARVGHFEPETLTVEIYRAPLGQTTVAVIDTPGLCDAHIDKGNDEIYVETMAKHASPIDLLLFVTRFDDNRVTQDEIRSLELITARFGRAIWDRAIVVMTHADRIRRADFAPRLKGRSAAITRRLTATVSDDASAIPMIPVANGRPTTPDGQRWLTNLWIASAERIRAERYLAYHFATADRIVPKRPRRRAATAKKTKRRASERSDADPTPVPQPRDDALGTEIALIAAEVKKLVAAQNARGDSARTEARPSSILHRANDNSSTSSMEPVKAAQPIPEVIDALEPSEPPARLQRRPATAVIEDGVEITTTNVVKPKPVANNGIVVNRQEAGVINNIYQSRASALGEVAKTAARWVIGKARKLLFGI